MPAAVRLPIRLATLVAVLALSMGAAGCGNKKSVQHFGDTEGTYLDVGNLKYQVQISRQLNPADNEDRAYLQGLSPAERVLHPDEAWFAIFVLVQNNHGNALPATDTFVVSDAEENKYTPVPLDQTNQYAYRGGKIPGHGQLPRLDTPAQINYSIGGQLLLFKVKYRSFDNRPMELTISQGAETARIDLDV
jgi:hypothetical protein